MAIARFLNGADADTAREALLKCCASIAWATQMISARPFASDEEVVQKADAIWFALGEADWLEAFAGHPRIGERAGAKHASTSRWSSKEQVGMAQATSDVEAALLEGNRAYEDRFGHVFLICATGKSAAEMLKNLQERLGNTPAKEMKIATEQQALITRLRLGKLVD